MSPKHISENEINANLAGKQKDDQATDNSSKGKEQEAVKQERSDDVGMDHENSNQDPSEQACNAESKDQQLADGETEPSDTS